MDHIVERTIIISLDKEEARALNAILCNFIPMKGAFSLLECEVLNELKDILAMY